MSKHVFVIVKDEHYWLPIWLRHYVAQGFSFNEITVLNNGGPIDVPVGIRVVPVTNVQSFDHNWLKETVKSEQRSLLKTNDVVVFAEVDEFLFWQHGTVEDLCSTLRPGQSVRATGYSPLQDIDNEPSWTTGSLLKDRKTMMRTAGYDKVLVSTIPLTWCRGFHIAQENQGPPDPSLIMCHMWTFDFDLMWQRIEERRATGAVGFFGGDQTKESMQKHFRERFSKWEVKSDPGVLMYAPRDVPDSIKTLY